VSSVLTRRQAREIALRFQRVECGCGRERLYGHPCACGRLPAPTEIDQEHRHRTRVVQLVAGRPPRPIAAADSLLDLSGLLVGVLERLVPETNLALADPTLDAARRLASTVATLDAIGTAAQGATRLRPFTAFRPELMRACSSASDAVAHLLACLGATDLGVLQRENERLQPALDAVAAAALELSRLVSDQALLDEADVPLSAILSLAAARAGTGQDPAGILQLARWGQRVAQERFDLATVPYDLGPSLAVSCALATVVFDERLFWEVAVEARKVVTANTAAALALASSPEWRSRWAESAAQVVAAGNRGLVLSRAAASDREAVFAALDYCHDMQEGAIKSLLATLRVVAKPNIPYAGALGSGVRVLSDWYRANGNVDVDLFAVPSRKAKAHNDWRIDGDQVVLCELAPGHLAPGPVRLDGPLLRNHVLAVAEFALALHCGVLVAMRMIGAEPPDTEGILAADWQPYIAALFAGGGWTSVEVAASGDTVSIRGSVGRVASLTEFGAVVPYVPDAFDLMVADITTSRGRRTLRMPLAPLRALGAAEVSPERELALVACLARTTLDQQPMANRAQVRKVVAHLIAPWIASRDEETRVTRVFRAARTLLSECGDEELVLMVRRAQGWRKSNLAGITRATDEIQAIFDWGATVLPEPDKLL
jgi:hypothetical protein